MLKKVIPFGSEMRGKVESVDDTRKGIVLTVVVGDDGEGYLLLGSGHSAQPKVGNRVLMVFTKGGLYGGYWKITRNID